jgi:peptidoglycan hydrolase-like protein with peptidoglycan-binding domain
VAAAIAKASPVKVPDAVQQAIAQALASKDVAKMGAVAQQLAKNYPFAGQQLQAAAASIAKSVMTGAPPVAPAAIYPGSTGSPPSAPVDTSAYPLIMRGSTGNAVKTWQGILGITKDGIFGPGTQGATQRWQAAHGLPVDGKVGPQTWKAALSPAAPANTMTIQPPTASGALTPDLDAQIRSAIYKATDPLVLQNLASVLGGKGPTYQPLVQYALSRASELRAMLVTASAVQKTQAVLAPSGNTLRIGSTGSAVKEWQTFLGITADGQFGPNTDTATRRWQAAHGLTADGIVGPNTLAAAQASPSATAAPVAIPVSYPAPSITVAPPLSASPSFASMPLIQQGSSGAAVKTWQQIIGVTADGSFGPATRAATIRWQAAHGLTADGQVGPHTWAAAQSMTVSGAPIVGASPRSALYLKTHAVAQYIKGAKKGSEDRMMIKNWQIAAGVPSPDGLFQPRSAERMAELGVYHLPIIMYWPQKNHHARLITYRSRLNELAAQAAAAGHAEHAAALRASAHREQGQQRQTGE